MNPTWGVLELPDYHHAVTEALTTPAPQRRTLNHAEN
jgi:hypothetical protein